MKTHFLSHQEREIGAKNFLLFTLFNGLGFGFLADTTVYLLAIHFGASNIQLGYISSLIQLSGIILIISPRLLSGINIIKIYFWSWLFRGLVCLINGLVCFISGQTAVAIILTSYTMFCIVRILGVALYNPMIQMVSTPSTIGHIITSNNARFNLGNIFGKIISFFVVSIPFLKELYSLLSLQLLGVIFNTIGAFYLLKIPCREKIENAKAYKIFAVLFKNIFNKKRIMPLLIHWNYISILVMSGFSIPLLKKIMGLPQNTVFFYTIIIAASITVSMYIIKPVIDKVAGKPIIIFSTFLDVIFFVMWAMVKQGTALYIVFILGAVSIFIKGINQSMIGRMLLSSIPQKDKITYNSMISFFAGIFAFSFGMMSGYIADIGEKYHPAFFNPYYIIFLAAGVLSVLNIVLTLFIEETDMPFSKEIAEMFLSFRNIKSLVDIHQLETTTDPQKRQSILLSLKYSSAPMATNEIRKILKNPLSSETEEVLKSLFTKPRPKLLQDILEIAGDEGSYHRATAIFALGAYPLPVVEKALISFLNDENTRIRSNAAKSLARIGNADYLDKFIRLSKDEDNSIWDTMNYIIAALTVDRSGDYLSQVFRISDYKSHDKYKQAIFSLVSKLMNFSPELSYIYQRENMESLTGIRFLLDEIRQLEPFYKDNTKLKEWFVNSNYKAVWVWVKDVLKKQKHREPFIHLANAIINYKKGANGKTSTIAALYFAFYIMIGEHK